MIGSVFDYQNNGCGKWRSKSVHLAARLVFMIEVTQILHRIEQGDGAAARELLPLVYDELRKLAGLRMAQEHPGQTLQATALVHEAFLRLVSAEESQHWNSRGHFFAAAAESMRRILVENARRKSRVKRGGEVSRHELQEFAIVLPEVHEDLLALNEALDRLQSEDAQAAQLVHLRYFAGFSVAEAAKLIGISARTADRLWAFARAWLRREISVPDGESEKN